MEDRRGLYDMVPVRRTASGIQSTLSLSSPDSLCLSLYKKSTLSSSDSFCLSLTLQLIKFFLEKIIVFVLLFRQ